MIEFYFLTFLYKPEVNDPKYLPTLNDEPVLHFSQ